MFFFSQRVFLSLPWGFLSCLLPAYLLAVLLRLAGGCSPGRNSPVFCRVFFGVSLVKTYLSILVRDGVVHYGLPPADILGLLLLGAVERGLLLNGVNPRVCIPPQEQVEGDVKPAPELLL